MEQYERAELEIIEFDMDDKSILTGASGDPINNSEDGGDTPPFTGISYP